VTAKSISELVERLRFEADEYADSGWIDVPRLLREAASALEHLEAENARLREALEPFSAKVAFLDNEPLNEIPDA